MTCSINSQVYPFVEDTELYTRWRDKTLQMLEELIEIEVTYEHYEKLSDKFEV